MKQNLTVVEEIDLEQFIAETKHDGVSGFEPLFDVYEFIIILELYFFLRHLLYLFIEMNDKPF